jgi:hypothetical protein
LLDRFGQLVAPGANRYDGEPEDKKESLHGETVVISSAVAVLTDITEFGFISEPEFCSRGRVVPSYSSPVPAARGVGETE